MCEQKLAQTLIAYFTLQKLIFALNQAEAILASLLDILFDLRAAAVKSRPSTALLIHQRRAVNEQNLGAIVDLLDEDDMVLLEHNRIDGVVSFYGMPAPVEVSGQRAATLLRLDQQPNEPGGSGDQCGVHGDGAAP